MSVGRNLKALYNACNKVQHKLLPPVVVIIIVLLILRWANTPPRGHVWNLEEDGLEFTQLDDNDIQRYIHAMEDSRSEDCKHSRYTGLGGNTVSIVLDFSDHEFYDLKMTLEAILKNTDKDLYSEIIILDDGTGHDHVMQDAMKYLGQPKFEKVRAFRSEKSEGVALSRFKASKMAKGSILVFVSSRTAVNKGWLEPLVEEIKLNPKQIAVPHMDSLLSNYRYFKTQDNLINVFDWKLSTLFMETDSTDRTLKTPVMTGDVFAVQTKFLDSIGNYDEGFEKGGGENLELSLRTWMCGGSIAIIPCSRVAVRNALKSHDVKTGANFRRIVELWLGSKYRRSSYKTGGIDMDMAESERQSLQTRGKFLEKTVGTCSSFHSYLRDVAPQILLPGDDSRSLGKVRAGTGYCLHSELLSDGRIQMQHCKPHMYEPNMVFKYDLKGRLMHGDLCIEAAGVLDTHSSLKSCEDGKLGQAWNKLPEGQFQSVLNKAKCLAHGYTGDGANVLELKECSDERPLLWSFIKY